MKIKIGEDYKEKHGNRKTVTVFKTEENYVWVSCEGIQMATRCDNFNDENFEKVEDTQQAKPMTRTDFFDWMNSRGMLDKFLIEADQSTIDMLSTILHARQSPIACGFDWSKSKDGVDFWMALNDELRNEL